MFHVFAAVAEFERELTLERTYAGLVHARALGRRGGRKPAMGPAEIKRAKAMLADPTITVEEVAQQIGVQPSRRARLLIRARSGSRNLRARWSRRCGRKRGACSTASGRSRRSRTRRRRNVSRPTVRFHSRSPNQLGPSAMTPGKVQSALGLRPVDM